MHSKFSFDIFPYLFQISQPHSKSLKFPRCEQKPWGRKTAFCLKLKFQSPLWLNLPKKEKNFSPSIVISTFVCPNNHTPAQEQRHKPSFGVRFWGKKCVMYTRAHGKHIHSKYVREKFSNRASQQVNSLTMLSTRISTLIWGSMQSLQCHTPSN